MIRFSSPRVTGTIAACFGLLLLAACEDPSGVGLSVVDFGETDPRARTVVAETELDSLEDFTGFLRTPGLAFTERIIAGRAEDPVYGTIEATGYLSFALPGILPPNFLALEAESGFLDLVPDYIYGDTTQTANLELFELSEAWDPLSFTSDTTLPVFDDPITTFMASAADTLVRVPLPAEWVQRLDSLIKDEPGVPTFRGLQVRPQPGGRLALGFNGSSTLAIVYDAGDEAEADTLRLLAVGLATGVETDLASGTQPEELIPLQDNSGVSLVMTLRLDTLDSRALSAGLLRIEADTLLLEAARPANFVRPVARELTLFGLRDGPRVVLATATLDEEKEAFLFSSSLLNHVFQEMALGRSEFDRLAVGFARSPLTLAVAPMVSTPEAPPRAVVLIVPADL